MITKDKDEYNNWKCINDEIRVDEYKKYKLNGEVIHIWYIRNKHSSQEIQKAIKTSVGDNTNITVYIHYGESQEVPTSIKSSLSSYTISSYSLLKNKKGKPEGIRGIYEAIKTGDCRNIKNNYKELISLFVKDAKEQQLQKKNEEIEDVQVKIAAIPLLLQIDDEEQLTHEINDLLPDLKKAYCTYHHPNALLDLVSCLEICNIREKSQEIVRTCFKAIDSLYLKKEMLNRANT